MLLKDVKERDVIKFALEAYMIMGGNPAAFLQKAAGWLHDCYLKTEDKTSLEAAVQIIYAYKEIGLFYEDAKEVFDKIIFGAEVAGMDVSLHNVYSTRKLKLKSTAIREVLGRWSKASKNQQGAAFVTQDIIDRVNNDVQGATFYGRKEDSVAFQLLVLEDAAYLLDFEKRIMYVLDKESKRGRNDLDSNM